MQAEERKIELIADFDNISEDEELYDGQEILQILPR
jgi:hypothetical protein